MLEFLFCFCNAFFIPPPWRFLLLLLLRENNKLTLGLCVLHVPSVAEVEATLIGSLVGSVLEGDDSVAGPQLLL